MEKFDSGIYFLLATLMVVIGVFTQARKMRSTQSQKKYDSFQGKKIRFTSAEIDGQKYGGVIEFKAGEHVLGVKCYFPKFNMVVSYGNIRLSKERALIGSVVKLNIPNCPRGIIIKHSVAKKINSYSKDNFGYRSLK